jgi:hypothetical protein
MRIHHAVASAAFALAIVTASAAFAFETTSVGGQNADGSAKFQDPDVQALPSPLGDMQFGVQAGGSAQDDQQGEVPPWQLKPSAPSPGYFSANPGTPDFLRH